MGSSSATAYQSLFLGGLFLVFGVSQSKAASSVWECAFASFVFSLCGAAFWAAYQLMQQKGGVPVGVGVEDETKGRLWAVISNHRVVNNSSGSSLFVEYRIDVRRGTRAWSVWRRYSQFVELDGRHRRRLGRDPWWYGRSRLDLGLIASRTVRLNDFLDSMEESEEEEDEEGFFKQS